ncbi:MAG: radical SAM family heme chaperone HemW [Chryseolinea sp.]
MAGLYLHIPFCKQACHYCDFHFSTNQEKKSEIIHAFVREIELQKDYLNDEPINTIYFGGGTPSLLSSEELRSLMNAIQKYFSVSPSSEITLEANPDDLTKEKLLLLKESGINRLSIGIQSFDDEVLQFLNRAHDSMAAENCVELARKAGFDNISIDLIYAIPNQNHRAWAKNIERGLDLKPNHISSYSLTIEEKTAFGRWAASGKLKVMNDEFAAAQLITLVDKLEENGFEQYEVSNFALPGFQSQHNSSYWKQQKYLGIGPSAHSYNGLSRQFNISNNHLYLKSIEKNSVPATLEVLTQVEMINDYLLTTLRTSWGANLTTLEKDFSFNLMHDHKSYINSLVTKGLAQIENGNLILTKPGKLFADKIASDLFVVTS